MGVLLVLEDAGEMAERLLVAQDVDVPRLGVMHQRGQVFRLSASRSSGPISGCFLNAYWYSM